MATSASASAQTNGAPTRCQKVGGSFLTSFVRQDHTAGVATGDLAGALGVQILQTLSGAVGDGKPVTMKVHCFWVTESGDSISGEETEAVAYPSGSTNQPMLYTIVYEKGLKIVGGTGKFEGATGSIKIWAAADFAAGQSVGRYSGIICLSDGAGTPLLGSARVENGEFSFLVQASPGRSVVVESSSDLEDWEQIALKEPIDGAVQVRGVSSVEPQRFFRAKRE